MANKEVPVKKSNGLALLALTRCSYCSICGAAGRN
jgi:hypothetical protein